MTAMSTSTGDYPQRTPARELSDEEREKLAESCFEYEKQIKTGLRTVKASMWAVAEALWNFDRESGWQFLGYDTMQAWLAQPEIYLPYNTYRDAVKAWDVAVRQRQIPVTTLVGDDETDHPGLDISKFNMVAPALKKGTVTTAEAIADVETMGWRDLRDKYVRRPPTKVEVAPPVNRGGEEPEPADPAAGDDEPPAWGDAGPSEGLGEPEGPGTPPEGDGEAQAAGSGGLAPDIDGDHLVVGHEMGSEAMAAVREIVAFVVGLSDLPFWAAEKKKVPQAVRVEQERVALLAVEHGLVGD
jgi:hypothetical protein